MAGEPYVRAYVRAQVPLLRATVGQQLTGLRAYAKGPINAPGAAVSRYVTSGVIGATATDPDVTALTQHWMDAGATRRLTLDLTNPLAVPTHDALGTLTLPANTAGMGLALVEVGTQGQVVRPETSRYANGALDNLFFYLPAVRSGNTVQFKMPGKMLANESRKVAAYLFPAALPAETPHLGFGPPDPWVASLTLGATGDTYAITIGGTTATYTQAAGDTAALAVSGLAAAVTTALGAQVTAAASGATVNVTQKDRNLVPPLELTTTTPTRVALARPLRTVYGRVGPNTDALAAQYIGLPSGKASIGNNIGLLFPNAVEQVRLLEYQVAGDNNGYGLETAQLASATDLGGATRLVFNVAGQVRSGQPGPDWTGTLTVDYQHVLRGSALSDGSLPNSVNKQFHVAKLALSLTAARTLTLLNGSAFTALSLYDLNTGTASGATPRAFRSAGAALGSAPTTWNTGDAMPGTIVGTVFQTGGPTHSHLVRVDALNLGGLGAAIGAPNATQGSQRFPQILATASNGTPIAAGTTIGYSLTVVTSTSGTAGQNAIASEAFEVLDGLQTPLTNATVLDETPTAQLDSLVLASVHARAGLDWFVSNAAAKTTVATNYAFDYDLVAAATKRPWEDDGTYGTAHAVRGGVIDNLISYKPAKLARVELLFRSILAVEARQVQQYGAAFQGCGHYWIYAGGDGPTYADPNGWGYTGSENLGPQTYAIGDARRRASIDQATMILIAVHAILVLGKDLPWSAGFLADVLAYLRRANAFELAHYSGTPQAMKSGNLLYIVTNGAEGTRINNGMTATQYNTNAGTAAFTDGSMRTRWLNANATINPMEPSSSNLAMDDYLRGLVAPDTTQAGFQKMLLAMAEETLTTSLGAFPHEFAPGITTWGNGSLPYPLGWMQREAVPGNRGMYDGARPAGQRHYIEMGAGGNTGRDMMGMRIGQRAGVIILAALANPNAVVRYGPPSLGQTIPIRTLVDAVTREMAVRGFEGSTSATRLAAVGRAGGSGHRYIAWPNTCYMYDAMQLARYEQEVRAGRLQAAPLVRF